MLAAIFVLATAIVAMGSALQAATGMGMALFSVPLLALLDPALVPGPSLCAVMAPAGRFSTSTPYCRQTWVSWLSDPVRYSQFGTVLSPSSRSKAWVNSTAR